MKITEEAMTVSEVNRWFVFVMAQDEKFIFSIFSGHLNAEESIQGYDLYSSTIADVLSDPALKTPITVGLYAKWGSGKSFLINKLQSKSHCTAYQLLGYVLLHCHVTLPEL